MVTTRVTFRSVVVNVIFSFVGNAFVKALLVLIALRVLFPIQTFDVIQILVVGALWQLGQQLVFTAHFQEIITETHTRQPQTEAEWLASHGFTIQDKSKVE